MGSEGFEYLKLRYGLLSASINAHFNNIKHNGTSASHSSCLSNTLSSVLSTNCITLSDFSFNVSTERMSVRLTSGRPSPRYIFIDDHCCHSIHALAERIQDHAKLLVPKSTGTAIFLDQLPLDDDDHSYKAMLLGEDKSEARKVLLEGEYKFSSSRSEAKRKAMEVLLKKSGEKAKEAMEKPKAITSGGRWVFLPD